jgi:UDP-N-acetylmuramoyl-L-alanyl-D-glutamate--2,6-diaminopimelate ligase
MRLLGVTGTNGKTTTAFLLRSIMERWTGRASGLISTVEYSTTNQRRDAERTTPDASEIQAVLAETLESGSSDAVIEVSSHSLVQNRLGTAKFAAAVFTNLTGDHLDYHKTMDAYFDAKRRLFTRHLAADGTAVLNLDDPCGRILAEELRSAGVETSTFGFSEKADVRVMDLKQSLAGISLTLRVAGSADIAVASKLCGAFNAANVAGAAAAALALGATPEAVSDGVAAMTGVPGRMERRPGGNFFVDYAHTDDALKNALSMMRSLLDAEGAGGRLILLFGCGGDRDKTKRPRMAMAAAKFADEIFITSDNPRSESPTAIIADILKGMPPSVDCEVVVDRAEAIKRAVEATGPNDALLVAGKGHETYQEVNGRRFPFDDRDMVDSAVACRGLRES